MLYLFNISYFHFFFYFFIVGALHKHFPHFMETHHGPMANRTFWIPNKIWWNLNASFNKQLLMLHERKTNKNKEQNKIWKYNKCKVNLKCSPLLFHPYHYCLYIYPSVTYILIQGFEYSAGEQKWDSTWRDGASAQRQTKSQIIKGNMSPSNELRVFRLICWIGVCVCDNYEYVDLTGQTGMWGLFRLT